VNLDGVNGEEIASNELPLDAGVNGQLIGGGGSGLGSVPAGQRFW
jgi:hypothetical protein